MDLINAYRQLDCYPDVRATLKQLKDADMQIAILSNGSPSMLQAAVKNAGIEKLGSVPVNGAGISSRL